MKFLELNRNDENFRVYAEVYNGKIWCHYNGKTQSFNLDDFSDKSSSKKPSRKDKSSRSGILKAPMPGKIMKVYVSEGQKVNTGDSLLVMEAMKMEYDLKCEISGKIKEIRVCLNDQVSLSEILIVVEGDISNKATK